MIPVLAVQEPYRDYQLEFGPASVDRRSKGAWMIAGCWLLVVAVSWKGPRENNHNATVHFIGSPTITVWQHGGATVKRCGLSCDPSSGRRIGAMLSVQYSQS